MINLNIKIFLLLKGLVVVFFHFFYLFINKKSMGGAVTLV